MHRILIFPWCDSDSKYKNISVITLHQLLRYIRYYVIFVVTLHPLLRYIRYKVIPVITLCPLKRYIRYNVTSVIKLYPYIVIYFALSYHLHLQ